MKLYIELEDGDKVLEEYAGTFLVDVMGHCFKSLDCRLKDYRPRTKIRADYLGYSELFTTGKDGFANLPWKEYHPKRTKKF